jgi:predicted metal-dependent hydrolase
MDRFITIIRRPVKHARLRVREDASVQLIVPEDFDQAETDRIMRKKAVWIEQHQRFFRNRATKPSRVNEGEILLFDKIFRFVRASELGRKVLIDEQAKQIRSGHDLSRRVDLSRWYRRFRPRLFDRSHLGTQRPAPFALQASFHSFSTH